MALGIRGANPIWFEVDLQGELFDDTFYLFVLENTIPYIPATVYHDPDLSLPWTNPIQFLGNGTLPIDIFYEPGKVYRLEFRQHIGPGPATQADPLIYEVNNYVPGEGGSTPVDTVAFTSSNQITNPQFSLMNLESPTTITGTDPDPIEIAPGWTLLVAGTGTVTINQVPLNDTNANPSNAPYALRLTLSGWTANSVILRQRFEQNGMLWADKFVSTALTARIEGSPQSVTATLVDSNDSVLGIVLPTTPLDSNWNEYTGYAELPDTTNPDEPPAAYIDYLLQLPTSVDIYLTSFQLVVQDLPVQPSFEQDSINRQIDHTYNASYPLVPVGTIIDFAGFEIPEHYYLCDGAAKNRIRDYLLFHALTTTELVTLSNGSPTFTVVSAADYHIGMNIEGDGIPAATTISNIVGTTITMSANATASASNVPVTFFAWGNGDGSTTFNVPNLQGFTTAGANGSLFSNVNGVGLSGGSSTHTIIAAEIPAGVPTTTTGVGTTTVSVGADVQVPSTLGSWAGGSATPINIVQPTKLVKKCIRYQI